MEGVANENQWCTLLGCHCAGISAGCEACKHYHGRLCTVDRSTLQKLFPKPVCKACIECGVTRLCPGCPESKAAAAEKEARLVCSPCMSEPACVPPEAAASFDTLEAMWQELSRVKLAITKLEESLLARMTKKPPHAAFASNEAPLLEERADAQLAPQGRTWYVGGLD